jgi:hypothetical protein
VATTLKVVAATLKSRLHSYSKKVRKSCKRLSKVAATTFKVVCDFKVACDFHKVACDFHKVACDYIKLCSKWRSTLEVPCDRSEALLSRSYFCFSCGCEMMQPGILVLSTAKLEALLTLHCTCVQVLVASITVAVGLFIAKDFFVEQDRELVQVQIHASNAVANRSV